MLSASVSVSVWCFPHNKPNSWAWLTKSGGYNMKQKCWLPIQLPHWPFESESLEALLLLLLSAPPPPPSLLLKILHLLASYFTLAGSSSNETICGRITSTNAQSQSIFHYYWQTLLMVGQMSAVWKRILCQQVSWIVSAVFSDTVFEWVHSLRHKNALFECQLIYSIMLASHVLPHNSWPFKPFDECRKTDGHWHTLKLVQATDYYLSHRWHIEVVVHCKGNFCRVGEQGRGKRQEFLLLIRFSSVNFSENTSFDRWSNCPSSLL